jgi:hypothetical protein
MTFAKRIIPLVLAWFTGLALGGMDTAGAEVTAPSEQVSSPIYVCKPSNLAVADGRKLAPKDFEEPANCSKCHPRQFKGWQGSMHSRSFKDPVFQAESGVYCDVRHSVTATILDDPGRAWPCSGALDQHNRVNEEETVNFGNHLVDKHGKSTVNPWEIARFDQVNTIPLKGYRYGKYAFALPADAKSFSVTAKLNSPSYDQVEADHLLGDGAIKVPTVEMKALTRGYDRELKVIATPARVATR